MSLRVRCPTCDHRFAVFDRLLGRTMRCPNCRREMVIPTAKQIQEQQESEVRHANMVRMLEAYSSMPEAQLVDAFPTPPPPIDSSRWKTLTQPSLGSMLSSPKRSNNSPAPRKRVRSDEEEKGRKDFEWDITPMVDVAFLLLIFFMLTASFSIQKVIRTAPQRNEQPSSSAVVQSNEDNSQTVTVHVDENNGFAVVMPDGRTLNAPSKQDLIVLLADAKRQLGFGEPPKMIVLAHDDSMHGTVVAALDAGREADFSRFEMVAVQELD